MAKLVMTDAEGSEGPEFPLKPSVTTIGRVVGQDVFVKGDSVSREHAQVQCVNDEYFVIDMGSLNGVFVNGKRVAKSILKEGDEIRFGKVRMFFSNAPCQHDLERRGGGVFARFFGGSQEVLSGFDKQLGSLLDFVSSGSEKVEELETNVVDTLKRRTEKFETAYRQLTILYRVSQLINTEIEAGKVFGQCLDLAVTTLKAEMGVIYLYDSKKDELELYLAKSRDPSQKRLQRAGFVRSIARRVFETNETMVLSSGYSTNNTAILTHGPSQSAFICAPILGREDLVKGVLYFDSKQQNCCFGPGDIDFLATFGAQLAMALDRDSLIEQVVVKKEMEREMNIARDIQQRLLPSKTPTSRCFQLAGRSLPSKQVGGDYYDFFITDPAGIELGLITADVSGKGIPAALVVSQARSILNIYSQQGLSPAEALGHLNEFLLADFDGSMYVTLVYCLFDFESMTLKYSNAGHEYPMLISAEADEETFLNKSSKPCGLFEGEEFLEVEVKLNPGDRFVFPTDGLIDAESRSGEKFGLERLKESVMLGRQLSPEACLDKVFENVQEFSAGGGPQFDDMTLVVLDVVGPPPGERRSERPADAARPGDERPADAERPGDERPAERK